MGSGGMSVSCLTKCGTMDAGASQGGSFKIKVCLNMSQTENVCLLESIN